MVDNNIGITAYKGTNKLSDLMMADARMAF